MVGALGVEGRDGSRGAVVPAGAKAMCPCSGRQQVPRAAGQSGSGPGSDGMSGERKAVRRRRRRATGKSGLFIHTRGVPFSSGQSVFFHRREMN